uniref:Uncharacterized protein n=1 Tax=Mus spicilegus TaxID=10103 RepID=A0A8C6I9U3_MUSSI
ILCPNSPGGGAAHLKATNVRWFLGGGGWGWHSGQRSQRRSLPAPGGRGVGLPPQERRLPALRIITPLAPCRVDK